MIHFSLFSGMGGFEFAAEMMGWKNYLSCEINPFGQRILKYYWPASYHHDDVKTLTYGTIDIELSKRFGNGWRCEPVILTGGFPCQPYSTAGNQLGTEDPRHLWPEMLRTIREIRPDFVVGENVRGLIGWNGGLVFDQVRTELETEGFEVIPFLLPACGIDAPHRRERIWFIAHAVGKRYEGRKHEHGGVQRREVQTDKQDNREIIRAQDSTRGKTTSIIADPNNNGLYESENGQGYYSGNYGGQTRARATFEPEGCSSEATGKITFDPNIVNGNNTGSGTSKISQFKETGLWRDSRAWEQFPTQPAVCSRNDGLPSKLDGITISNWRIESIMAAGNAIVPEVAIQIFKAIEETENAGR